MIYLYIYIGLALIFGIMYTRDYLNKMYRLDPRSKYFGKWTKFSLLISIIVFSTIFAPLLLIEVLVKRRKVNG